MMKKENRRLVSFLLTIMLLCATILGSSTEVDAAQLKNAGTVVENGTNGVSVSQNEKGQTVYTLSGDLENGCTITLTGGETAILDGAGHKINGKNASGGNTSITDGVDVSGEGTLIVKNVTLVGGVGYIGSGGTPSIGSRHGIFVHEGVNLIVEGTTSFLGSDGAFLKEQASDPDETDRPAATANTYASTGGAGCFFQGINLLFTKGSHVTISGGNGGRESQYDDPGDSSADGLVFDGKWFTDQSTYSMYTSGQPYDPGNTCKGFGGNNLAGRFVSKNLWERTDITKAPSGVEVSTLNIKEKFGTQTYKTNSYVTKAGDMNLGQISLIPHNIYTDCTFQGFYEDEACATPLTDNKVLASGSTVYAKYDGVMPGSATPTPEVTATPKVTTTLEITTTPTATATVKPKATIKPLSAYTENSVTVNKKASMSWKNKSVTVYWGKVTGAAGYDVYVTQCGSKKFDVKHVNSSKKTSLKITKVHGKKISNSGTYKAYVKAFKKVKGKKVYIGKSLLYHMTGPKNKKCTNVSQVAVKEKTLRLSIKKTKTLHATLKKADKKKRFLSKEHGAWLRYMSSNALIAKVDKKGKVTAQKKGSCTIYVIALNGKRKTVKVTVQ